MADLPDWTTHEQIKGTDVMVATDIQGTYVMLACDIQGQYVTLEMDIVAQSIGNINVNIAAQSANINVNLSSQTGDINVNIAAQAGNVTISVAAQAVAIKNQGEWAPQQSQQKYYTNGATNQAFGGSVTGSYTVPSDKNLYITHIAFANFAHSAADGDKLQIAECYLLNFTTVTYMAFLGGNGGGGVTFPTPIKIAGGQRVDIVAYNYANHNTDIFVSWGGYEI